MCTYTGLSSFLGLPLWLLHLRVSLLDRVNLNFSVFCDVQVFLNLRNVCPVYGNFGGKTIIPKLSLRGWQPTSSVVCVILQHGTVSLQVITFGKKNSGYNTLISVW